MKALMFFYIVIWLYAIYYSCYMLYKVLGEEAIPLYIAFGLLFLIKWIVNYNRIKL